MDQTFGVFVCSYCHYQTRQLNELLIHYSLCHQYEPNFSITCYHRFCHRIFKSVRCLKRHISEKHPPCDETLPNEQEQEPILVQENVEEESLPDENGLDQGIAEQCIKNVIGRSILSLRESQKIPYKTCSSFLNFTGAVLEQKDMNLLKTVQTILKDDNVAEETIDKVTNAVEKSKTEVRSCIEDFSNAPHFNRYVENNLAHVAPQEYFIGGTSSESMQYVPILETLKQLLAKEDVFAEIVNSHQSQDGKLRDICDGEHFRSHPFWSTDPSHIQIVLYFDEFTAVIQSGCYAPRYKYGGFYYQIGNIDPSLRSELHCIQLAILAKSKHIKSHGLKTILNPLIKDLKQLEDTGITIGRPEGDRTFRGSLLVVLSDNLGAHEIGSFILSFVALRSCRFCFITRPDLKVLRDISQCVRRSAAQYDAQADLVSNDATLKTAYGITGKSPLNELSHYHVVPGLPPDAMHDLYESGVATDVLQSLIKHYAESGNLSLDQLCVTIKDFKFKSHDKSNKPEVAIVNGSFNFKQKSAQVWCLVRTLPLLIGHVVPTNDTKWEVAIALKEMVDIIMSPVLSPAGVTYLGDLVGHFHSVYQTEFPQVNLKPKGHYTLHYKESVLKYGPLKNLWTMRFEAKHSFFIDIVRRTKNRKNLCKTMAQRHQYMQAMHLQSSDYLGAGKFEVIGQKFVDTASLTEEKNYVEPLAGGAPQVLTGKKLSMHGTLYDDECVVVREFSQDDIQFAHVRSCFVIGGIAYLFCEKLETISFKRHYQAYLMEPSRDYILTTIADLPDPHPLPMYKLFGQCATVLHHYIDFD